MSEQVTAPVADAPISAREAAAIISAPAPEPKEQNTEAEAPSSAAEPVTESPSQEADASPAERPVPSETEDADPAPDDEPSIEPPRSWSKDHKDAFKALPRHLQEAVSESERAREADFHTRTREAAERAKAVEAREQQAEQTRQQYEQALPSLIAQMNLDYQSEFGNPTWNDIDDWSRSDQPKYVRWQAYANRFQAMQSELQQTQARQQQETAQSWEQFRKEQTKRFEELAPEYADPETQPAHAKAAHSYLVNEIGFSQDELVGLINGFQPLSMHDHRVQLMVRDAVRYRQAEKAAKAKPAAKSVPPVQRPGTPPVKGEAKQARLKDLDTRLDRSGSAKDAARLISARLAS